MPKDSSGKGRFFLDIKATDQAPPSLQKSATIRVWGSNLMWGLLMSDFNIGI